MRELRLFVWRIIVLAPFPASVALAQDQPPQPEIAQSEIESPVQPLIEIERAPSRASGESRQGGPGGGMGGSGMGSPGYKAIWYPARPVSNSGADFRLVRQNLSGAVPIWLGERDTVLLTAGVRNTLFSTNAILPDTQRPFPSQLWNISTGLMYIRKFANGWTGRLNATLGSASDKPFNSIDELNVSLIGFLQRPARNDRDAWLFSIFYSPVGNLNFPIPGVAYLWKPSDELSVSLGIPFSVNWKPVEDLTLTFSYIPVTNINARAAYRLRARLEFYGGFEWLNEAYFLADRAVQRDRFVALEKRLVTGLRWDLWKYAALDVNAGYAFDRFYGEGQNQFSNLRDRVDLEPGAFLGASLLVRW